MDIPRAAVSGSHGDADEGAGEAEAGAGDAGVILATLALALAQTPDLSACRSIDRPNPNRAQALAIISCVNREVARQMREGLPTRVDEITTLVGVVASGTSIIYSMRIDGRLEDFSSAQIALAERGIRTTVCSNPDMRSTIGYGGSYQYVWLDRDGRRMHSFAIENCPPAR